jgi:drug/metabolite transporter (DMT)-like permease
MSAAPPDVAPGSRAPMSRLAAIAVLSEAVLVGGYGVFLGLESVVAPATERLAAVVMAVFCAALAVALVVLARALGAGRRWARTPVLVWQVLQASVAAPALSTLWPVGVGLILLCLLAAVGVVRMRPAD